MEFEATISGDTVRRIAEVISNIVMWLTLTKMAKYSSTDYLWLSIFVTIGPSHGIYYGHAATSLFCTNGEDIEGRDGCNNDVDCWNIARMSCDDDPNCFGIRWYENYQEQKLALCRSNVMESKDDGWHTIMKLNIP